MLVKDMRENEKKGNDCSTCEGTCCTFVANSMQITPIEALEILEDLECRELFNQEVLDSCNKTLVKYRLDQHSGTGRKGIRKTYTCPFFMNQSLGCGISISKKPYGCLAFNPRRPGQTEGGECFSDQNLLENRERLFSSTEKELNSTLIRELNLDWRKVSIPEAVLSMYESLKSHSLWKTKSFKDVLNSL